MSAPVISLLVSLTKLKKDYYTPCPACYSFSLHKKRIDFFGNAMAEELYF